MDLAEGKIGAEGAYEVDLVEGKIIAKAAYDSKIVDSKHEIAIDLEAVLDKVAEKLPEWAKHLVAVIKGAMKAA